MTNVWLRKYWWVAALVAVLVVWWILSRGGSETVVHTIAVGRGSIQSTVPTNGKVEPVTWAAARAEVSGVVRQLSVTRGQTVRAGDTLVQLDDTSPRAELATAQARRQEAAAELASIGQGGRAGLLATATNGVSAAQTGVEIAQRNLETEQRLLAQQASTKYAVQQAEDALTRAKSQLAAAQDQRRTLVTSSDRAVAEAKLHDAEAAVALAQRHLNFTRVTAPVPGVVYQFDLKVGAYLQTGDLVAYVGDIDQVKIAVYVDEPDLGRVALQMPVSITWDARPGQTWSGHVEQLPTEIVALGTRNVGQINTVVDNPSHDLLPGVTVNATIQAKEVKDALIVPKAALRTLGSQSGVYRVDTGNVLRWTPVQTGISDINNVQVVSGLAAGASIVEHAVEPSDIELTNGMHVRADKQ